MLWKSGPRGINHIPYTSGMPGVLSDKFPEAGIPPDLINGTCCNVSGSIQARSM